MDRFTDIRQALDNSSVSAEELCRRSLSRAQEANPHINSFLEFRSEIAIAEARQADLRIQSGERLPLLGMPIAVKDNILVEGSQASAGSRMLAKFRAPYSATAVERLRASGAIIIGKTNLDEFGMGSSNENSAFGVVKNPWDHSRVPGGSSGGSAAAVSGGIVPLALGSDTGGSIRQPASFCGVVGLRPTYGRVSRWGLIAFASSLDTIGPISTCALSAAAMLDVASGADPRDATCSRRPGSDVYSKILAMSAPTLSALRIAFDPAQVTTAVDESVRRAFLSAIERWKSLGAQILELTVPNAQHSLSAYYLIASSEASSNLSRYSGLLHGHRSESRAQESSLQDLVAASRSEGFGAEVQRRILLGTFALSSGYYDAYFRRAAQVRRLIVEDYAKIFAQADLFVSPTAPSTAFRVGEKSADPLQMYLSDIFTLPSALAGLPAVSFPAGLGTDSLPVGIQAVGPAWSEARLLEFVRSNELASPKETLLQSAHVSGGLLS